VAHFLSPALTGDPAALVVCNERTGGIVASDLLCAFDSSSRRQGLLGRDAMADNQAIVLAPCAAVHTFFMRFPIDVVFTGRDGTVRKVRARVPPWRIAASFGAFAALELPAGRAAAAGLQVGDRLALVPAASR